MLAKNFGNGEHFNSRSHTLPYLSAMIKTSHHHQPLLMIARYGEEGMVLPKDGGRDLKEEQPAPDEDDEEYRGPKDHTLVLDADSSPMAEQVLLQLILSRAKVKAFAKNVETAKAGFGPYVEITADPTENPKALARALRNVNAVVCCSKITPQIVSTLRSAGVPHLVVLSMVGAPPQGFSLFGNGEAKLLAEPSREQAASSSGVSTTIIRVGPLLDVPGGQSELRIAGGNEAVGGSVSREDAARMLAEAAFFNRKGAAGVVVCGVGGVGPGQPPEDYAALMSKLMASPVS